MGVDIKQINSFWEWFSQNCNHFGNNFENESLLNELDEKILSLGNFSWEVGPGQIKSNQLVISPNGELNMLPYAKEIIEYRKSNECLDWEFYYAKPPKKWEYKLLYSYKECELVIDISKWEYVLLQYEDGLLEIILKVPTDLDLEYDDQLAIADISLDSILGEEIRMIYIERIEIVHSFSNELESKASNIKTLNSVVNKLTAKK